MNCKARAAAAMASPMIERFLSFLRASPSPFHAVDNSLHELTASGWAVLKEADARWSIRRGGQYVLTRNGSSLLAFTVGSEFVRLHACSSRMLRRACARLLERTPTVLVCG